MFDLDTYVNYRDFNFAVFIKTVVRDLSECKLEIYVNVCIDI